jgi:hypothetical protein
MSAINDLIKWYKKRGVYQAYSTLVGEVMPGDAETVDLFSDAELAALVFERTGLLPTEFLKLDIPERLPWLRRACRPADKTIDAGDTNTRLLAMFDEHDMEIVKIAGDSDLPVDDKAVSIMKIDSRYAGYDSPKWGQLLNVSAAAVRKCDFWKTLQERKKAE